MFGLLVTPKPLMDESLYGYLYRLAHTNGLAGLEVVAMHRSCMAASQKEWVKIHSSLSWLLSVEELLHPATEAIKAWSPQNRKCCSQCLEESPGVRIVVASPFFPKKVYRGRKETGRAVLFT
ncbi:hypothetical protein ACIP86_29825, partial [Pseudomonas neuropathica]